MRFCACIVHNAQITKVKKEALHSIYSVENYLTCHEKTALESFAACYPDCSISTDVITQAHYIYLLGTPTMCGSHTRDEYLPPSSRLHHVHGMVSHRLIIVKILVLFRYIATSVPSYHCRYNSTSTLMLRGSIALGTVSIVLDD